MISRRSFLAALASLPFVGKMIPQQASTRPTLRFDPWVPMTVQPSEGGGQIFITSGDHVYVYDVDCNVFDPWHETVVMERKALGLPVAELDQRYQNG